MATATSFNTQMARKKPVHHRYQPNSYRVISFEAESWDRPERAATFASIDGNVIGQPSNKNVPYSQHRKNRPNPNHVGFLRQDVRLLNEPVCDVYTDSSQAEQYSWWPSRTSNEPLKQPEHTLDTIVREDFQYRGQEVPGSNRHSSNPNIVPAHGIAPVNFLREKDGKQRFWKEGISYEHQYNSRLDPQYPIRGKRHGTFVWDRFSQQDVDRMVQHFVTDAERKPSISSKPNSSPTSPKSACLPQSKQQTPIPSPPSGPKSAHPNLQSSSPVREATVEVSTGKPLSRAKTESVISAASQLRLAAEQVKLPPIGAL